MGARTSAGHIKQKPLPRSQRGIPQNPQKVSADETGEQIGIHAFQLIAGGRLDCEL